jgi:queuine tRNA-ribosyltransferase
MRDESRLRFEIAARDGAARTGVLYTSHGRVHTPAFIPLATKGTVRGLESREVAELGYEMVLGNTYHLFVSPGPERIAAAGGLHGFMGWERALITDSGGFQVFSLAHGGVADEIKGSGRKGGEQGSVLSIGEEGVRFRSYRDGAPLFISPEVSMRVQAALGSDIALVFDECTPFHADREYTARSTERTHRWLDRCLEWHEREGPPAQAVFGIVQGGVHEDLRRESAAYVSAAAVDGLAIGGTLGRDKEEMREVLAMTAPLLPAAAPKHLLGIGEVDDLLAGIALGLDVFDCAVPTRLARHGVALVPDPGNRFRLDLRKSGHEGSRDPIVEGCPCPACRNHDRDYVSYLSRAEELTAVRLICLHNLTYLQELMTGARAAIEAENFASYSTSVLEGTAPWAAA